MEVEVVVVLQYIIQCFRKFILALSAEKNTPVDGKQPDSRNRIVYYYILLFFFFY